MRALKALGITSSIWHVNEGHTTFMMLERARGYIKEGMSLDEASARVRQTTVFTTHTSVAAGHDFFPDETVSRYFSGYFSPAMGNLIPDFHEVIEILIRSP